MLKLTFALRFSLPSRLLRLKIFVIKTLFSSSHAYVAIAWREFYMDGQCSCQSLMTQSEHKDIEFAMASMGVSWLWQLTYKLNWSLQFAYILSIVEPLNPKFKSIWWSKRNKFNSLKIDLIFGTWNVLCQWNYIILMLMKLNH